MEDILKKKIKLIIDCDTGADDAEAILMILSFPEQVEVIALTTVMGNSNVGNTTRNSLRLLKFAGRPDIPVYKGCSMSLIGAATYNVSVGPSGNVSDGLGDVNLEGVDPVDESAVQTESAPVALCRLVAQEPGEITLLCTGPLTNIATALMLDDSFGLKLKNCVIMGGNIFGHGNKTACAEFNFYSDPEAAHSVLNRLGCQITVLPLETCEQHSLDWVKFNELVSHKSSRNASFIRQISATDVEKMKAQEAEKYGLWDQLAAAVVLRPDCVLDSRTMHASVELHGSATRGQMFEFLKRHVKPPHVYKHNVQAVTRLNDELFYGVYAPMFQL